MRSRSENCNMGEARKPDENSLHRKLPTTKARVRQRRADDAFLVPGDLCLQVTAELHRPRQLGLLMNKVCC